MIECGERRERMREMEGGSEKKGGSEGGWGEGMRE